MAVVRSMGELVAVEPWSAAASHGSMRLYDSYYYDYATLYRTQPNVRVCVDFLARNIAQLGLHVYRRVSDTDRERLTDHPLAKLLARPNDATTGYRLIERTMADLGVYYQGFWVKVRPVKGPLGLLPTAPPSVTVYGQALPMGYRLSMGGVTTDLAPSEVVHFRGYNPESGAVGMSPLETLRRVLAEEAAMGEYRENFWANSARMYGVVERPADAPEWSKEARDRWRADWEALYSGKSGSGKTGVLEEGMTWKEASFNAQQSEYLGARKLTREECARSYHIPLPMIGILDHATFSNIKEQHRNLYQDSLGPWLRMIEQELELQLLPEFEDREGVYLEFNIQEKLSGSFEDQTASLQAAIGRPWMTPNEGRARLNLPSIEGGDTLMAPLNMIPGQGLPWDEARGGEPPTPAEGEPPAGEDGEPKALPATKPVTKRTDGLLKMAEVDASLRDLRARHVARWQRYLERHFRRQQRALSGRVKEGLDIAEVWPEEELARWDEELGGDFYRLNTMTARAWASHVTRLLDIELDDAFLLGYLAEHATRAAQQINRATRDNVAAVLGRESPATEVTATFDGAVQTRAPEIAGSQVTNASSFGAQEGARQGGLKTKTWVVNSNNPRPEHMQMDGETVGIRELFSNGMRWPGDPAGGAANVANCECSVAFGRGE